MTQPQVIIRGRRERREFAEPYRQCVEMLASVGARVEGVSPPVAHRETLSGENQGANTAPLFIFFQSYPQEFPQSELAQLRRDNPFAPFLFVLGACCEGMLRTAGPLDSPFYRYVHGWGDKDTEQIRLFLTDQPSLFSLPLTAENDEIAQWETKKRAGGISPPVAPPRDSPVVDRGANATPLFRVLILTHFGPFGNDSAMNRLLADEQERLGYTPIFSGKALPETFEGKIVADVDDSPREKILESIQRLRRQFADNDFTVYVDSPRFDEKNDYIKAGVTRILPKIR